MSHWRWGRPLSREDAENVVRSLREMEAAAENAETSADRYPVVAQVKDYMKDKGLTEYKADADQRLVRQTLCEQECKRRVALIAGVLSPRRQEEEYAQCVLNQCMNARQ